MIIIQESDFYIERVDKQYVLYILGSKKEPFKIKGYYINLTSAIKSLIRYRKHKKYKGKESYKEIIEYYKKFKKLDNLLHIKSLYLNQFINTYTNKVWEHIKDQKELEKLNKKKKKDESSDI